MNIGKVCSRDIVTAVEADSIQEVVALMREYHVGSVVVQSLVKDCKPVGIVTGRDIVIEVLGKNVPLDAVTVGDVMSQELLTVSETDDWFEVVKKMRRKGFRRVPVLDDDGFLVGIFTVDAAIELMAELLSDLVGLTHNEEDQEVSLRH